MTEKLFYKDSHLSKFDAEVLSCVRAKRQQVKDSFGRLDGKAGEYYEIELDRTAFFPGRRRSVCRYGSAIYGRR